MKKAIAFLLFVVVCINLFGCTINIGSSFEPNSSSSGQKTSNPNTSTSKPQTTTSKPTSNVVSPTKLLYCHRIDEDDYCPMEEAEDCFGNKYEYVFGFDDSLGSNDGGYAIFYLNGQYKTLKGIFVGSNELYKDMEVDCRIYADGRLIYTSPKLGRTSEPVNINLNVSGVRQLRVEYMWYSWWTTDPCCIFDLTVS